jgi:hypothetical protein
MSKPDYLPVSSNPGPSSATSTKHKLIQLAINKRLMTAEEGANFFAVWGAYAQEAAHNQGGGDASKIAFRRTLNEQFGADRAREIIGVMVRSFLVLSFHCNSYFHILIFD